MSGSRAEAVIARVEVRATGADPVTARLHAERLLGMVALRPRVLPPSAILSIRRVRDPLPGALVLDGRMARPPMAWEQALRQELDRLARGAAWPARSAVPAGAEAVAFADEAELLACAGVDLAAGLLGAHWWWPLLLGRLEQPARAVGAAWRRAAECAPPALARLVTRGLAAKFVRALDPGDIAALTAAIVSRFSLPVKAQNWGGISAFLAAAGALDLSSPAPSPWPAWVAEADAPELSLPARTLLGVALLLTRAPSVARSMRFAAALATWQAGVAGPGEVSSAHAAGIHSPGERMVVDEERPVATAAPAPLIEPVASNDATPPLAEPMPAVEAMAGLATGSPAAAVVAAQEGRGKALPTAPRGGERTTSTEATAEDAPSTVAPRRRARPRLWPKARSRDRAFGAAIDTELGGLFYLVNLALHLGLYGEAEDLSLDPWDLVTLIGQALLSGQLAADPVWPLLAALAGRAVEDPPGADFQPALEWRLPPLWLEPFTGSRAREAVVGGRRLVFHDEGFLVLEVSSDLDRAAELLPYRDLEIEPGEVRPPPFDDDELAGWVARLVPYLRARLCRALEIDGAALPALLLRHRGQVHVSDSHVDVVLSLEALPVIIRLAGLDRDPGWLAAAGRFIAFHFE